MRIYIIIKIQKSIKRCFTSFIFILYFYECIRQCQTKSTIKLISNFILIFTSDLLNTWILDKLVIYNSYEKFRIKLHY